MELSKSSKKELKKILRIDYDEDLKEKEVEKLGLILLELTNLVLSKEEYFFPRERFISFHDHPGMLGWLIREPDGSDKSLAGCRIESRNYKRGPRFYC